MSDLSAATKVRAMVDTLLGLHPVIHSAVEATLGSHLQLVERTPNQLSYEFPGPPPFERGTLRTGVAPEAWGLLCLHAPKDFLAGRSDLDWAGLGEPEMSMSPIVGSRGADGFTDYTFTYPHVRLVFSFWRNNDHLRCVTFRWS